MYQYDSKSKTQSEGLKSSASTANKNHTKTGIKTPMQLMPKRISSPLQMQLRPQQENSEAQPLPMMLSEEQTRLAPISAQSNNTGIPLQMKEKFENLSGFSFDDVRVHYNSDKPAQLQALAYTQGNQVHIGPGQEKHLGHELGHVVQQKQGRVQATTFNRGVPVNDSLQMEKEADNLYHETEKISLQGKFTGLKSYDRDDIVQLYTQITYDNTQPDGDLENNSTINGCLHWRVGLKAGEKAAAAVFGNNPVNLCNHHAPYHKVRQAIITHHLLNETVGNAIGTINHAIAALNQVGTGMGFPNIPDVIFDDFPAIMDQEFDDAIANVANDPRNLFYSEYHHGDAGGTQLDWPTNHDGTIFGAGHLMHHYSQALANNNML